MGGRLGAILALVLIPCPSQAEQELRVAQTEFDRQAEVTRLLLEGISSTHVSPVPFPPPVVPSLLVTRVSPRLFKFTLRQLVNLGGAEPTAPKVPKQGCGPLPPQGARGLGRICRITSQGLQIVGWGAGCFVRPRAPAQPLPLLCR